MKKRINFPFLLIIVISMLSSVSLGMLDYETQSFGHLFSKGGNIVALVFYMGLAFIFWSMLYLIAILLGRMCKKISNSLFNI